MTHYFYSGKKGYTEVVAAGMLDIYLAAQLDDYERDNSLENLSQTILGVELSKNNTEENIQKLGKHFEVNLPDRVREIWTSIEGPLSPIVSSMQNNGIYFDINGLTNINNELINRINDLEKQIKKELGVDDINLNSTQQLSQILTEKGYIMAKKTKTGKYSTGKDVLDELASKDSTGVIAKILEYRTLTKLQTSFTGPMLSKLGEDNRLRGTFHQIGAATGRMSTSNPSLQNIPVRDIKYAERIRSCFTAPENSTLIIADYSQIELRILAHLSGDDTLIDAFSKNQDIHARSASEIFDIPLELVNKHQRSIGKTLNFALMYQQGAFGTAKLLGITVEKAQEYMNTFFARFAKIKPFTEAVLEQAKENGFVESLWGRRRYFKNLTSKNYFIRSFEERAAFNAVIQSTEADLVKKGMLYVDDALKSHQISFNWVLQIHDEIVIEVSQKDAESALRIVSDALQIGQPLSVPIIIDAEVAKRWS